MNTINRFSLLSSPFLLLIAPIFSIGIAQAQDTSVVTSSSPKNTLVFEGVGNDLDKEHRNPLLTVGIQRSATSVTLLADATVQHDEFVNSPIQFDFYVNRRLVESQMRSKALSGPIGFEVTSEVAPLPFNYTVVAKVIHPNRQFTSMIEGAVFARDFNATLSCTLSVPVVDTDSVKIYSQPNSKLVQLDSEGFSANLESLVSESGASSAQLSTSVKVKVADNSASATLTVIENEGSSRTFDVSGTVTLTDGVLSAVTLTSADGDTTLNCE